MIDLKRLQAHEMHDAAPDSPDAIDIRPNKFGGDELHLNGFCIIVTWREDHWTISQRSANPPIETIAQADTLIALLQMAKQIMSEGHNERPIPQKDCARPGCTNTLPAKGPRKYCSDDCALKVKRRAKRLQNYANYVPRVQIKKLTESDVIDIRKRYMQTQDSNIQMAKDYGVSDATISKIISRKIWRHVP